MMTPESSAFMRNTYHRYFNTKREKSDVVKFLTLAFLNVGIRFCAIADFFDVESKKANESTFSTQKSGIHWFRISPRTSPSSVPSKLIKDHKACVTPRFKVFQE
ncbi:hypothetical protein L798_11419 [Zootermopsis nevadensis]|uniref:Uncharacterized protein n=1 Tax=Zootermopsis nevadensis TaxID=136037 RepID=A0A067QW53_ZOONE|nr:hypothetical protein L798_11419 [Zootermopsis nevadensis]